MHHKALAGVALLGAMVGVVTDGHAQRKPIPRAPASAAVRTRPRVTTGQWLYVRSLAQTGLPQGIGLSGTSDRQVVTFRLPAPAPVIDGRLRLQLHFSGGLIAQSNVQIFANGARLAAVSRTDADARGNATLDLVVPANLLSGAFLALSFQSSLATMRDQCLDARLGLPHVQVQPESNFSYVVAVNSVNTVRTALAILPDTVTLSIPSRRLEPFEFWSAYTAASELSRQGYAIRYTQLPQLGDVTIGTHDEVAGAAGVLAPPASDANISVFRYSRPGVPGQHVGLAIVSDSTGAAAAILGQSWMALDNTASLTVRQAHAAPLAGVDDPTFADLRLPNLERYLGIETTWRLGVDIRDLPAGRVPTHVDLRVATAPNTNRRAMILFVFWNGTLVRTADMSSDGLPQALSVDLPSDLVSTRNELRVTMQRHIDFAEGCVQSDSAFPAAILPTSRIVTGPASTTTEAFDAVAARLGASSPVYLPDDALDHPDHYLPMLVGIGRAFWIGPRSPRPTFYGGAVPPPLPTGAFILVGTPAGAVIETPLNVAAGRLTIHRKETRDTILDIADMSAWSVAEVVTWNAQVGVQLLPAMGVGQLPAYPEAYGSANLLLAHGDSTLFPLNTTGIHGTLVINQGPTIWMRLRRDWMLWVAFLAVLAIVPLLLGIRAVMRRTPRRDVRVTGRYPTPPRPPSVPGA